MALIRQLSMNIPIRCVSFKNDKGDINAVYKDRIYVISYLDALPKHLPADIRPPAHIEDDEMFETCSSLSNQTSH